MPGRTKTSTTRLPQSLLEQIQQSNGSEHTHKRHSSRKQQLSRKEARKQERAGRKQKKAEYFSTSTKRPAPSGDDEFPQRKRVKLDGGADVYGNQPKASTSKTAIIDTLTTTSRPVSSVPEEKSQKASKTPLAKHVPKSSSFTATPRIQKEEEEDAYIAYLEGKLGYGKKKGKQPRYNDGLDDLFDFTESINLPSYNEPEDVSLNKTEDESIDESGDLSEDDGEEVRETEVEGSSEEYDEEGEWKGIEYVDEDDKDEPLTDHPLSAQPSAQPATKYIPPHLRNAIKASDGTSEALLKLTKQLKGLLNRMSEQNIGSILDGVEEVYRNERRHDVTSTLTSLIIDGICSHSSLLDSYVVLYAAFVSSLYKVIGIEFAAYFVQNVVSSYEHHLANSRNHETSIAVPAGQDGTQQGDKGKEASNLVVLLSELYNFQVTSCVLIYDIVRGLLDGEIKELNVELLLKIVRNSGQQLRQDDPSALKDIIQIIHNKLGKSEDNLSSRTRFMIETLNNLKNNKVKRIGTQNQGGEAVERMKKFLSGLSKKRHVMAHEPLRVSLDDLHSANTKGKWWLVGAAWGGDPLVDRQENGASERASSTRADQNTGARTNNALLKLAKKQGMNTDIRRSIFVVLMSSDDYVDACERLAELKLTEVQQRDIIRVLIHCCGNEKTYNPYYTLVCQHLCQLSHSHKITLQYCLWDFLRDMGETEVGGMEVIKSLKEGREGFDIKSISSSRLRNVAKAYAWWIAKDCISLAVLKPVDFTQLQSQTRTFLRELFTNIFLCSQSSSPLINAKAQDVSTTRNRGTIEEIFIKATRMEALAMGLMFFLSEGLKMGSEDSVSDDVRKLVAWGIEVAKDTMRTGLDIVPSL
ncbi:mif4g ma4 domain-containing protein [Moniliophthora roreri MCA 2997]|uniref:Mif4g ma4 domain-containing protein n=1 Tax=Moniliophthora roreri (strain MCA 2997) TaxID=1381753 RepID=V2YST1_MONRO|nr:mif4g ma4 domain-containing protein [Moniliophthora roreri MCA 2997]